MLDNTHHHHKIAQCAPSPNKCHSKRHSQKHKKWKVDQVSVHFVCLHTSFEVVDLGAWGTLIHTAILQAQEAWETGYTDLGVFFITHIASLLTPSTLLLGDPLDTPFRTLLKTFVPKTPLQPLGAITFRARCWLSFTLPTWRLTPNTVPQRIRHVIQRTL